MNKFYGTEVEFLMGVKVSITKDDIEYKFLEKTKNGVSDSVFILDKKYILKIYESATKDEIFEEVRLLEAIQNLKVPKVKSSLFFIQNRHSLIFEKIKGISLKRVKVQHILQIGIFLKKFHKISQKLISNNRDIYSKENLLNLILKSKNLLFIELFQVVKELDLNIDGVIHGDLFPDNAKFTNNKLSGVYDFIEHSNGSFLFDISVIAISWCFKSNRVDRDLLLNLLKSYDKNLKICDIQKHIYYALLYYSVTRYLDNREVYKKSLRELKSLKL